jgi:uncharacterized protein
MKSKRIVFILIFFCICSPVLSQDSIVERNNVNSEVVRVLFSDYEMPTQNKRVLMQVRSAKGNPLTYIAAGLLFFYQNLLSEQISANCTYQMSCSEYTKKCIERYGIVKGTLIGLHQLSCCVPNISVDHCEHKISENYKIINIIE